MTHEVPQPKIGFPPLLVGDALHPRHYNHGHGNGRGIFVPSSLELEASQTRGKNFRKAAAPWTYRQARQRIECPASENRVLPIAVDPRRRLPNRSRLW
jgi:hypothetical protein